MANLVQFNNVSKQFNMNYLFKNISFSINSEDKIGLIGLNGAGKTTLVKLILGDRYDDGNIFINNIEIGYLAQITKFNNEDNTVYQELFSHFKKEFDLYIKLHTNLSNEEYMKVLSEFEHLDGYNIEYKINVVIEGLSLKHLVDEKVRELSGGEKTRLSLAKILLKEPDLLILDEPTNHLDIFSIEWLEDYIRKYPKAVLVISHDRDFLDNVANKIIEIEQEELDEYSGNFSEFLIQKELILKGEIKRYEKEQQYKQKMEEYITRYKAGIKSKQARGRQKILDRMEFSKNPVFTPKRMKLEFDIEKNTGEKVLEVKNVSVSYNRKILDNISFDVYKGDKIGIIGKNGIGKSTLLKYIMNNLDTENVKLGSNVKIGYFSQNLDNIKNEYSILEEINVNTNKDETYYRGLLGGFLFTEDDVFKKIGSLSGGEKVRVSLLKLMEQKPNVLILDEPTNHLDIYSIEVLEEALLNFKGSFIMVSHNRHLINLICNKIYILDENGLKSFNGNYTEYKNSIKEIKEVSEDKIENKEKYLLEKQKKKEEEKNKKRVLQIEKQIEEISEEISILEKEMLNYVSDVDKLMKIQEKIDKLKQLDIELMKEWEMYVE